MNVMRRLLVAVSALAIVWLVSERSDLSGNSSANVPVEATGIELGRAFEERLSDYQVEGEGVVSRVLADDNDGSRHQRFVLTLASGQTLLVAHNIDVAPRIASVRVGDRIAFFGEYEWNPEGGVIHWTHHDPDGRHVAGWLEHGGRRYQ